jgi:ABC-type Fe3+/spermidine/putrescine transport system ATPase subunit
MILDGVGLASSDARRRPHQLSGGQQQRVALARALVIDPELLLLDEPFANLDRALREQLRGELRALQERTRVATVLVTHDHDEAMAVADRIAVLCDGRLLQCDRPAVVYSQPTDQRTARLLGDANIFEVLRRDGDEIELFGGVRVSMPSRSDVATGDRLMIRPEAIQLLQEAAAGAIPTRVAHKTFLGSEVLLEAVAPAGLRFRIRCRPGDVCDRVVGDSVWLMMRPETLWRLPAG